MLPKSDRKQENGYQKVTEHDCEWPTPCAYPILRRSENRLKPAIR